MMVETLVPFLIYCVIMLCWMWNTKKLYKRDYTVFCISSILAPVIASYTYRYVAIPLLGNEVLYVVLVCLVTHIAINIIRRNARSINKQRRRNNHNDSLSGFVRSWNSFEFIKSWNAFILGVILFIIGIYFMRQNHSDLNNTFFIFANLLIVPSSIYLVKERLYKIDRIDMGYDLNCWSCRLIGILIGFLGCLFFVFGMAASLGFSQWLIPSVLFLAFELIVIGAFCEYRSFRRQGIFVFHGNMR